MANLAVKLQQIASNAQITAQKLANEATEKSFQYNREEANTARSWQTEMSNTAHQREVKDLIKAGLNPVLATNQGAQSYTTSSAQAQANDPSGAVSNLAATQMSGMAQGYSADVSAKATRAAAAASAKAMKEAAATQASAARYAAAMQYQTQKDSWKWKTDYMKSEYESKEKYMKSEYAEKLKLPVSNWASLVDKMLQRSGVTDTVIGSKGIKRAVSGLGALINSPSKAFKSTVSKFNPKSAYYDLNKNGQNSINNALSRLGVSQNRTTRNLLCNAVFGGSMSSWSTLIRYMPKKSTVTPVTSSLMRSRVHRR